MWYIYILLCSDDSYYTGCTNNVEKRLESHLLGKGAKYTKSHKPIKIVYKETFLTKKEAMQREWQIKKLSKNKKKILIANYDPERME